VFGKVLFPNTIRKYFFIKYFSNTVGISITQYVSREGYPVTQYLFWRKIGKWSSQWRQNRWLIQ